MDATKRWSGGILTTFWTIQFLLIPLHILAVAFIIMEFKADLHYIPAIYVAELIFFCICFATLPLEILGYLYHFLTIWAYLASQVFKTLFYGLTGGYAIYVLTLTPTVSSGFWAVWKWVNLGLVCLLLVTFISALMYGSMVVHKARQLSKQYVQVDFGESTVYKGESLGRSRSSV